MRAIPVAFFINAAISLMVVTVVTGCGPTIQTGLADAQLTMRVKTALLNDPELGTQPIDVEVHGGIVRISGRVQSADHVGQTERLVRRVDGVRDVEVTLQVAPRELVGRDQPGRLPSITPPDTNEPRRLIGLGVGGAFASTPGQDLGNGLAIGPVVRLRPRNGWGPSIGFGWTRTGLDEPLAARPGLADLIVRPVMGGVEYGVSRGRLATGFSMLGGYSFNSLAIDDGRVGPTRAVAAHNSLAVRTGVNVWYDITSRVGLNVFAGYRVTRPRVTFANDSAIETHRLNADAALLSVGVAYWVF